MKSLLYILLLLPAFASAQVELLKDGQPMPFRAVFGAFKNDTIKIVWYDADKNMVYRGFVVEKSFTCLNSTDKTLTAPGDRFVVARAFINEQGDAMRPPFAYCDSSQSESKSVRLDGNLLFPKGW